MPSSFLKNDQNRLEALPMGQFYFEERRPIVTIFAQQPINEMPAKDEGFIL